MLLVALIVAALQAADVAPPSTLTEAGCSLVVEMDGKTSVIGPLEGLNVLNGPERLLIRIDPAGKLIAVACDRSSVVPDIRDDRIVRQLNVKLYLSDPNDVTASLDRDSSGYAVRQVSGKWSAQDEQGVLERIALFNSRLAKP